MIQGPSHLQLDNMRDDYPKLVDWVWKHGRAVSSHGVLSHEISNLTVTLLDPYDSLPLGTGPISLASNALAGIQLVAGRTDWSMALRLGSGVRVIEGERLKPQLTVIASQLLNDPQTRTAIVGIRDPGLNVLSLQFLFRDELLELHIATGAWNAITDSLFPYAQLQMSMANLLSVPTGPLHLHAGGGYMQADDLETLDKMHETTVRACPNDLPRGFGVRATTWQGITEDVGYLLDVASGRIIRGVNPKAFTDTERWYLEQLRPYWIAQED